MYNKPRHQPLKITHEVLPNTNLDVSEGLGHSFEAYHDRISIGTRLLNYRYPIVILFNPNADHLQLVLFNIRTNKLLKHKRMKHLHHLYEFKPIIAEYLNERYLIFQNSSSILEVIALKSFSAVYHYSNSAAKDSLTFCYMNNQLITWEDGPDITFWQLFKDESLATLDLLTPLLKDFVQLNSRGILIVQSKKHQTLYFIDVVNRVVVKAINKLAYPIILAMNTEKFIYFLEENEMQGASCYTVFQFWIDEKLELQDEKKFQGFGHCPKFNCLDDGKRIILTDIRKAGILDFEGSTPNMKFVSKGDEFDAGCFMGYSQKELIVTVANNKAIWTWKY